MARSANGTSDFGDAGLLAALDGAANASFSVWIFRTLSTTTAGLGKYLDTARFSLVHFSDTNVYISAESDSVAFCTYNALTGTGWHHYCVTYDGSLSGHDKIAFYYDGVLEGRDASFGTIPTTLSNNDSSLWRFASDTVSTVQRFWAGSYAECGVWPVTLTAAEAALLAVGASPLRIRPDSLAHYWPLIGRTSPEIDIVGGANATLTGTAQFAHTRVFYPRRRQPYGVAGAAAGSILPFVARDMENIADMKDMRG